MEVESRLTTPLLWATGLSVMCSLQYGWNLANMNTPSAAMRADLGLDPDYPETDVTTVLLQSGSRDPFATCIVRAESEIDGAVFHACLGLW